MEKFGWSLERATKSAGCSLEKAMKSAGGSLETVMKSAGGSFERAMGSAAKELSEAAITITLWMLLGGIFYSAFAEIGRARKRKDHLMVRVITITSVLFWFCAAMRLMSLSLQ